MTTIVLGAFALGILICVGLFAVMVHVASRELDRQTYASWEKKPVLYIPKRDGAK